MSTTSRIPVPSEPPPPLASEASEASEASTLPDTNPPTTRKETIYGRLNILQTTACRLARIRDALKNRIDRKMEAHTLMFASRDFTIDYQIALTKHLNDFLEPLYNELEDTEVQLDKTEERISQLMCQFKTLESDRAGDRGAKGRKQKGKVTVAGGSKKRKRDEESNERDENYHQAR